MTPILLACFISAIDGGLAVVGMLNFLSIYPGIRIWFNLSFTKGDFVTVFAILALLTVLLFGLLSAVVANFFATLFGGRSFLGEALKVEFYGVLPYSFLAIPLALSILDPLPMLVIAVGFFAGAIVWQFYIVVESFKEIYGLNAPRSFVVSMSPLILGLVALLALELLVNLGR